MLNQRVEEIKRLHEASEIGLKRSIRPIQSILALWSSLGTSKEWSISFQEKRQDDAESKRSTQSPWKVNDNGYNIDLLGDYQVFATINVSHLSPYEDDYSLSDLRSNFTKQGEDDGGPSWTCQEKKEMGLDSEHYGLTMASSYHLWQVPLGTKQSLILPF